MAKSGFERFKHSSKGFREVMKSPGVAADLKRRGDAVAAAATAALDEDDWEVRVDVVNGPNRASVTVFGVPMRVESKRRVLGGAIDAAR